MEVFNVDLPGFKLKYYKFGTGRSPRVLITAGVHGDEVTGVYASLRLVGYLQSKQIGEISGTVIVVPVVNILGFQARTRHNPVDLVDLNRVFPEGAGSPSTRATVKAVWELAMSSDYVIDLHCAGLNSYQYVLALYEEFPKVKVLTDAIPWDTVVESTGLRGQLFVEATHRGVPSVIIETIGGDGYYSEEWGDALYRTILETLIELEAIVDQKFAKRDVKKAYYGKLKEARSPVEGFPKPVKNPGELVDGDDVVAYVNDVPVKSPCRGRLITVIKGVYAFKEELVARVAPVLG